MNRDTLKEILLDQKDYFAGRTNLIARDILIDKYLTSQQIVVISGVRRCGKSSLLALIHQYLGLAEADYCYFNFDDERITANTDLLNEIYNIHIELYNKEPIFFFDEIQLVKGWEKFVNRMYENGHKLYITGSNATLLSSEISSSLTGRSITLELFPFSFSEYLSFIHHHYDINKLTTKNKNLLIGDFNTYLAQGGLPIVVKEKDTELINYWFQDILYRDIVARYNILQIAEIKEVARFLLSNIGKIFSYATLQKITGIKSLSSIRNYLQYFERSYLLYYVPKYDYSVRKQIMNSKKVYTVDNGIANRLCFNFSENKGRLLENAIFLELKRGKKEIFYFAEKNECDFIVKENIHLTEAIQVCYDLSVENIHRELSGLQEAMAKYGIPVGYLIVGNMPAFEINLPDNISIVPAWKWLLSKV